VALHGPPGAPPPKLTPLARTDATGTTVPPPAADYRAATQCARIDLDDLLEWSQGDTFGYAEGRTHDDAALLALMWVPPEERATAASVRR